MVCKLKTRLTQQHRQAHLYSSTVAVTMADAHARRSRRVCAADRASRSPRQRRKAASIDESDARCATSWTPATATAAALSAEPPTLVSMYRP